MSVLCLTLGYESWMWCEDKMRDAGGSGDWSRWGRVGVGMEYVCMGLTRASIDMVLQGFLDRNSFTLTDHINKLKYRIQSITICLNYNHSTRSNQIPNTLNCHPLVTSLKLKLTQLNLEYAYPGLILLRNREERRFRLTGRCIRVVVVAPVDVHG